MPNKQEIGSEFLLTPCVDSRKKNNKLDNCILLENGRQCYKVLADNFKGKILFPSYACQSMIQNISEERIVYYDVDRNLNIDFNSIDSRNLEKCSIFIFVDYFGFSQSEIVKEKLLSLKKKGIILVEDITQSMFSDFEFIGDILISSVRKWFGIEGLGILHSKNYQFDTLNYFSDTNFSKIRYKAFSQKQDYMNNLSKEKIYLETFSDAEKYADNFFGISKPTQEALNVFNNYDYNSMFESRRTNYRFLENNIKCKYIKIIKKINNEVPLFMPVYAEKRDELRKYLISKKIYCPIHWPRLSDLSNETNIDEILNNILSIPIDQRYSIDDMQRIIEAIHIFYREEKTSD